MCAQTQGIWLRTPERSHICPRGSGRGKSCIQDTRKFNVWDLVRRIHETRIWLKEEKLKSCRVVRMSEECQVRGFEQHTIACFDQYHNSVLEKEGRKKADAGLELGMAHVNGRPAWWRHVVVWMGLNSSRLFYHVPEKINKISRQTEHFSYIVSQNPGFYKYMAN